MLGYNTKMLGLTRDAILYVLENIPKNESETFYKAVTKHDTFVVKKTKANKYGVVKHYITHKGENFDCGAALNAALYRKHK